LPTPGPCLYTFHRRLSRPRHLDRNEINAISLSNPNCRYYTSIDLVNLIIVRKCGDACQMIAFTVSVFLAFHLIRTVLLVEAASVLFERQIRRKTCCSELPLTCSLHRLLGFCRDNISVFLSWIDQHNVATARVDAVGKKIWNDN